MVIEYDVEDLATTTSQLQLINDLVSEMNSLNSSGNWVIVGHSMGGLVARLSHDVFQNHPLAQNQNIKAVLTVGAPHQGARAAEVSLGPEPGYINVQPVMDEFEFRVEEPLDEIHSGVEWAVDNISPGALDQLESITEIKYDVKEHIEYFADASVDNNVKDVIGVDGDLIETLNSGQLSEPVYKRSVIGAEKRFIVVRAANEIMGGKNGNEKGALDNFDQIRYFYQANRDAWHATQIYLDLIFHFGEAREARRTRDRWQRGRNALDNIDDTWGEMIDSYTIENHVSYQWEYVCSGKLPPFLPPDPYSDPCWRRVAHTTPVVVPSKNDIIIGPDYAVWNPNEDPNDRNINWYYDDIPADGGYNHFELRRYKRAYDLPGVFQQGDLAPPMAEAADWLQFQVFN